MFGEHFSGSALLPGHDMSKYFLGVGPQRVAAVDPSRFAILVRSSTDRDGLRARGILGTILTVAEAKVKSTVMEPYG